MIFEKTAAGFRFVSVLGVSKLPIRQIPNVRRGVPSIAILSYRPPLKGDTWLTDYGIVQFNGKGWSESWPGNIVANPGGTVLLSYNDLKPLWK